MALLIASERESAWARYMRDASRNRDVFVVNKYDLLVAIGETDDWIEAGSKGQLKNNLSAPCRTELTDPQINNLETVVTNKRQGEF